MTWTYDTRSCINGYATDATATTANYGFYLRSGTSQACDYIQRNGIYTYDTSAATSTSTLYEYAPDRCTTLGSSWVQYSSVVITIDPKEHLRDIIRSRSGPGIIVRESKRRPRIATDDVREQRARLTLARMIGSERYRRFLKDGFITARNPNSGLVYQIFTANELTCVYRDGQQITKLCVVLDGKYPPTDTLIVRYLLALNDEDKLWELAPGNKTKDYIPKTCPTKIVIPHVTHQSLVDIFAGLKKRAS